MIELNSVKLFAEENKELYTAFKDYRDQWLSENRGVKGKAFSAKSLDDKANAINNLKRKYLEMVLTLLTMQTHQWLSTSQMQS